MNSIRMRLIVALIAAIGAVWGAGVLWSYHSTQAQIAKVLDARLMESARMVNSMVGERTVAFGAAGPVSPFREGEGYSRQLTCQIWRLDGTLLSHSDNAPDQALNDHQEGFAEREIDGEVWRSYAIYNEALGVRVLVGDKVDFRSRLIGDVIKGLLLPLVLVMPLIALLIWWSVSKGLRPLDRMAETLSGQDASNLEPLPAAEAPAELKPPIVALNALLARVEQARSRERDFTAYAAHELKTPLAGVKTQAQIALASKDEATRDHALSQILRGVDRTDRLVRQLLDLARIDNPDAAIPAGAVRLSRLVREVMEDLEPLRRQRQVTVSSRIACEEALPLNAELLRLAIRNVVENAILASRPGQEVAIDIMRDAAGLSVTVLDQGPGMSPAELAAATTRFYRGANGGELGSGLGLAIVATAISRLSGALTIENHPNGGLSVRLSALA